MHRGWIGGLVAVVVVIGVAASAHLGLGGGRLTNWLMALHGSPGARAIHAGSHVSQPPSTPSADTQVATIPFKLVSGHVVLTVTVNDSRPLSFVLDTGDKFAVIDLDRAREVGAGLGRSVDVKGVGSKRSTGAFVEHTAFAIPGLPGFSQPVTLAIPLKILAAQLGTDIDGILGADFIGQFVLELDYQARVIRLHNKDTYSYAGSGESIPIHLNAMGHPILDAEVTPIGREPIKGRFALDIGASSFALFSPFVAEHHLPGPNVKTIKAIGGGGTGGAATGQIGRVSSLRIGSFTLRNPVTLFSEDTAGAFANADISGNIGEQITSRFKLFLDYSHDRIIFEPTATFADPFDRASSGLSLEALGKDYRIFRVTGVRAHSPASDAGLQRDDVITGIDGLVVSDLTLSLVLNMFQRPVSRTVTVRRGDRTLTVTLTPKPVA